MSNIKQIIKRKIMGQKLWNLSVEDDESFVANDIVVHNCKSILKPNLVGGTKKDLTPGGLRPTGSNTEVERALKSITLSEGTGPHYHLDKDGEATGPAVTEGELHYHEKNGGGRLEAAYDEPGHRHVDENSIKSTPAINIEVPHEKDRKKEIISLEFKKDLIHDEDSALQLAIAMFGQATWIAEEVEDAFHVKSENSNKIIEESVERVEVNDSIFVIRGFYDV